jgi:hypothetical protein
MTHLTARSVRHGLSVALLAVLGFPGEVAAEPFSMSQVTVGGATVVGGGPQVIVSDAEFVAGPGYSASAYTDRDTIASPQGVAGGARSATNGQDQNARAQAFVLDTWRCPANSVCASTVPIAPMIARVAFDGILDPLIAALISGVDGTDESSLSVFFNYVFPGGSFTFNACYEPGPAFERAESGCGTPLEAYISTPADGQLDLTDRVVLGLNTAGQTTVAFDYSLSWFSTTVPWDDTLEIITDIRSNDSNAAHLLDFFNTFKIAQMSADPNFMFTSDLGRTSEPLPIVSEVPEPGTLLLLGSGLVVVARASQRRLF